MQVDAMQRDHSEGPVESAILVELGAQSLAPAELKGRVTRRFEKLPARAWNAALDELVGRRRIYRHYKRSKNGRPLKTIERYSLEPPLPSPPSPEELAPAKILELLERASPPAAELKKRVRATVAGLTAAAYEAAIDELVRAKRIYARRGRDKQGKPKKTVERYVLGAPSPADFLEPVLRAWEKAKAEAAHAGVDEQALAGALASELKLGPPPAPAVDERDSVLRGLRELVDREGAGSLIAMRKLRAAVSLPKARFDAVLLELYASDAVILHHHDHVSSLSAAERESLVVDEHGNYYVGVALRGGS